MIKHIYAPERGAAPSPEQKYIPRHGEPLLAPVALLSLREEGHYDRDSSTAFRALYGCLSEGGDVLTWTDTVCVQGDVAAAREDIAKKWFRPATEANHPVALAWQRCKDVNELIAARARVEVLEGALSGKPLDNSAATPDGCSACNAEHGEWCRVGCPGWSSIINGTGPAPSVEFVAMVRADLSGFIAAMEAELAVNAGNHKTDLFTASARWAARVA